MRIRLVVAATCGLLLAVVPQTGAFAATQIEHGSYLVNTIMACGNCHSPRDSQGKLMPDKALSGGLKFTPLVFVATASNITPDRETGIGMWTDDEIKRALTEGVRPDHGPLAGTSLAAVMPANFYKGLLPADLDAIVVYLRSVKPVSNQVPDPEYKAPVKREPYPDAELGFASAWFADTVTRGKYLAMIGHCMECHATWSRGTSDFKNGLGHGGPPFAPTDVHGFDSAWRGSIAANLTSDPTAGIGAWTDDEVARAITKGVARDGHQLKPPMGYSRCGGTTGFVAKFIEAAAKSASRR